MGWRFRQSRTIAPGLRLNLGKRSVSATVGPRGARVNVGRRGVGVTLSLLGTGLGYVWRARRRR